MFPVIFIHGEGASLSPTCVDGQNAYQGRWDCGLIEAERGGNVFHSPHRKLGNVVLQPETIITNSEGI